MSSLLVVLKKEIKDSTRDYRALMVALLPAIFGPLLMGVLFSSLAKTRSEADDLAVAVIGQQHAPDLISFLKTNDVLIEDFEGDPRTEIRDRNVTVILSIPEDYQERFAAFERVPIQLLADESLDQSQLAARRVRRLIEGYNRSIGTMRLMTRGVNPIVASPIRLETQDFATATARASRILAGLQLIMLMAAFFGGAGVAIDTTAGERERKSLEPLLVHPLTSFQIMGGKWLTVVMYGLLATLVAVVSTATVLKVFSLEALGVDPRLTADMQVAIFTLLIPMALLAASLQMLVSLFAKTFKEAQSYLGLLPMLPMLPIMVTMFRDVKTAPWMYSVPILGQQQLVTSVMRGEGMQTLDFLTTAGVTTIVALGIFGVLVRLLRSERVVYGS